MSLLRAVILSASLVSGAYGIEPQSFFAGLSSDDPKVRLATIRILPDSGPERTAILSQGLKEPDPIVRARVVNLIASGETNETIRLLSEAAGDADASVRWAAVEALGQSSNSSAAGALVKALKDSDPAIRMNAAKLLARIPKPERHYSPMGVGNATAVDIDMVTPLIETATNSSLPEPERRVAVVSLGQMRAPGAAGPVRQMAQGESTDPNLRSAALAALPNLGDADALQAILPSLRSNSPMVRFNGVRALGRLKNEGASRELIRAYQNGAEISAIRAEILVALAGIGGEQNIAFLIGQLSQKDEYMALMTARSLAATKPAAALPEIRGLRSRVQDPYSMKVLDQMLNTW